MEFLTQHHGLLAVTCGLELIPTLESLSAGINRSYIRHFRLVSWREKVSRDLGRREEGKQRSGKEKS